VIAFSTNQRNDREFKRPNRHENDLYQIKQLNTITTCMRSGQESINAVSLSSQSHNRRPID
jgi:hypothetical protein